MDREADVAKSRQKLKYKSVKRQKPAKQLVGIVKVEAQLLLQICGVCRRIPGKFRFFTLLFLYHFQQLIAIIAA